MRTRINRRTRKHRDYVVDTCMELSRDIVKDVRNGDIESALHKGRLMNKYHKRLHLFKLITQ